MFYCFKIHIGDLLWGRSSPLLYLQEPIESGPTKMGEMVIDRSPSPARLSHTSEKHSDR